jgi:hypothetical protein
MLTLMSIITKMMFMRKKTPKERMKRPLSCMSIIIMEIFIPRMSTSIPIGHHLIGGAILLTGSSIGVIMIHGGVIPGTAVTITIPGTGLITAGIIMIHTGLTGMVIIPIQQKRNDHLSATIISAGSERTLLHQ